MQNHWNTEIISYTGKYACHRRYDVVIILYEAIICERHSSLIVMPNLIYWYRDSLEIMLVWKLWNKIIIPYVLFNFCYLKCHLNAIEFLWHLASGFAHSENLQLFWQPFRSNWKRFTKLGRSWSLLILPALLDDTIDILSLHIN